VTPKASRRLLLWAIVVSLFLHALLAGWIQLPLARPQDDRQIVTISHPRIVRVTRATPPPGTPRPAPTALASAPPQPRPTSGRGPAKATAPPPQATPTPQPPPAVANACKSPNAAAALAAPPQTPELAAEARASGTSGNTVVLVHLNADGTVASAAITGSSGNGSLDLAALHAAQGASYAPAYKDCKAVAADYTFVAKWVAM